MPDRTLSIAGEAPGTSATVREWNRQLQRIHRLQSQLADLQALALTHRQALQVATAPMTQALTEVRQQLARCLADALDGKQLAGADRRAALVRLARLASELAGSGDATAREAHDRHSDIPLAERQAQDRTGWQERVEGWRQQTNERDARREARQARREQRRQQREARQTPPGGASDSASQPTPDSALPPGDSPTDDPATLLRRLFRQLASALHPDREPDPAQRERKTALMAEANRAHAGGDLPALLRLQQQVLQAQPASGWDDARLAGLLVILRRQVADLERERAAAQQNLAWEAGLAPDSAVTEDALALARRAAAEALAQALEEARVTLERAGTTGGLRRWLRD
ncbi:hypothetical protein [uncultured Hydrogenophaga sp.]|uniref:hypothetical protein n=1 Tax=uncultured Hydrogenophaga sp. TaxID=199683 RepID=UPI00265DE3E2|nr:hypothetical protein [uncultured Hydrogenophaga sp.]